MFGHRGDHGSMLRGLSVPRYRLWDIIMIDLLVSEQSRTVNV